MSGESAGELFEVRRRQGRRNDKKVIFHRRLFVSLSVCLLATSHKNYWSDLRENFTRDVIMWTRKNWLHFGTHPHLEPNLGIFWRILGRFQNNMTGSNHLGQWTWSRTDLYSYKRLRFGGSTDTAWRAH